MQSHAANLAALPGRRPRLRVVRRHAGRRPRHLDLVLPPASRHPPRGRPAEQLSDDPTRSEQNPILFTAPDGDLWLLYTAQKARQPGHRRGPPPRLRATAGRTWGPVETLFAGDRDRRRVRPPAARGAAVRPLDLLPDLPLHHRARREVGRQQRHSAVMITDDAGATWSERARAGPPGLRAHEHPAGATGRFAAGPASAVAGPTTSTRPRPPTTASPGPSHGPPSLPNNNSSIQQRPRRSGELALVYNPARRRTPPSGACRSTTRSTTRACATAIDGPVLAEPLGRHGGDGRPQRLLGRAAGADDARRHLRRRAAVAGRVDLETGDGYCLSNNSRDGLNREFSYPSILPGPRRRPAHRLHLPPARHQARAPAEARRRPSPGPVPVTAATVPEPSSTSPDERGTRIAVVTGASSGIGSRHRPRPRRCRVARLRSQPLSRRVAGRRHVGAVRPGRRDIGR